MGAIENNVFCVKKKDEPSRVYPYIIQYLPTLCHVILRSLEGRGLDVYTYTDSKANGRVVGVAFKRLVVINRRLDSDGATYKERIT